MLTGIVVSGETGVALGAARAAITTETRLVGHRRVGTNGLPLVVRDRLPAMEFGSIDSVRRWAAKDASFGLLVLPNRLRGGKVTNALLHYLAPKPWLIVDKSTPVEFIQEWLAHIEPYLGEVRDLLVAGPTLEEWPEGEGVAYEIVMRLLEKVPVK